MTNPDTGKALLEAFGQYYSALETLISAKSGRDATTASRNFQAAYLNIFKIAGQYFGRDANGNKVRR